ncbi:Sec23-binding domain of Sec16-domain-containing protein [Cladochytrium replicatum]|nr:Sec23-binding domain of Sec16-domain-containing protein [Cladochytrium replicatum]
MRGHAIATFSFGKLVVTKPSRQNRFVTGANGAQTVVEKAYPDKVSIIQVHTLLEKSFTDTVSLHPGPIISAKSKPKKKELAKIADEFVQRAEAASKDARQAYDVAASGTGFRTGGASSWVDVLRAQEQVLLMRVIRLAIENDGVLLGAGPKGDASTAALRDLLLADHDPNTYSAIGQIESLLLQGDRAGACRAAIGADLWAHALVIASHVDKETYTDVVMNFSQREFDPAIAGAVTQVKEFRPSLKLLYGLFGGMGRVAVAEYLPDDVDTVDESSPLQGWKEVLAIILSNRTPGDVAAISALGDRLRACNRLAAAHICYLLSTSHSLLSGVDAVGVRLILLDADHVAAPYFFFKDVKAVQLTELYEASQTLISGMGLANGLPHFQAYKMLYAMLLADVGYYEQAAKYCESIEVFVKTYSKGSPYFHRKFLEGLRDLSDRLSEATKSGSTDAKDGTSWFKTVSSAIDKGFNKIMNDAIGDPSGNPSADVGRKSPAKALTMVQDTFAALTGAASGSSLSLLRPQSTPASIASPVDGSTSGPMSGATHSSQMFIYGGTYASTEQNVSQTQSADVLSQDAGASYGGYSGYYGNGDSTAVGDYVMGFSQNQASAYAGNGYSSNQEGYAPAQNQYDQYGNAGYGTDGSYSQAGAEGYSSYQGYSNGYGESYDPNATAGNQATYDPNAGASYGQQPYDPSAQYGQTTDSHGSEYDQYGYGGQNPGSYATQESGYTQPAEYGFTYQPSQTEQTPDPYPYGQSAPVPDNAPKAAEQPARTQSVPPPSMSDTKHTDFEDDLGLGNNALKKKEDKNNSQGDGKEAAKPEKPAATSSYTSMFSSITKVIPFMGRRKSDPDMGGKEKEKATQVHLGGENPFVYNPTTKRWERKDGAPIREEEKKPPPPPMTPVQLSRGSTPAIPGTPSPALSTSSVTDGLPGRQPSPGPYTPGTKRGSVASRRTARSRYVDVMNPDSANRTPETSVKSFLPTPTLEGAEARVFKPLTPGVSTYSDMSDSVGETRPSGDAGEAAYGSAEPLRKAPAPGTPTPFAGAAPLRSSTSSAPPASFRPNRSPSARNAVPPPGAPPTPGTSQMSRSRIPPGLPSGANARPQPGPYVSPQGGPNPNVPSPIQPPGARYSSASPNTPPFVPNVAAGQANRHSFSGTRPSLAATPGGQGPPPSDL